MASRRPIFLDGGNAGLLAAILAVPLLAGLVWLGPLRGFVKRAHAEQAQHAAEIERLAEKKRTLTALAPSERERVEALLTGFEARVTVLGANANAQLARSISSLLEGANAQEIRVTPSPPGPETEPGPTLVVASLDGSRAMTLIPDPVQVSLRSDFVGLRAALDALREPGHTIQIESAEFARDGASVKTTLELVYWSREGAR